MLQRTENDAASIARLLSPAQRRYLTEKAEWRRPRVWSEKRWMTFPPANTHGALMALGLVGPHGSILDLGLEVRDLLMAA